MADEKKSKTKVATWLTLIVVVLQSVIDAIFK